MVQYRTDSSVWCHLRIMSLGYTLVIFSVILPIGYGFSAQRKESVFMIEEDIIEEITCWTCPNKSDNEACNDWAPDVQCPLNHTACKTVHHIHVLNLESIRVTKMCVPQHECTQDVIGCFQTHLDNIMECISCCVSSYCNELAPTNHSMALALSSFRPDPTASSGVRHTASNAAICFLSIVLVWIFSNGMINLDIDSDTHELDTSHRELEQSFIFLQDRSLTLDLQHTFTDKVLPPSLHPPQYA